MNYNEIDIIEGLKKNEETALKRLFDIYHHRLFCIARQYVTDEFIADTIVCDLFCHLWENRASLHVHISLGSYLVRSVRNASLNYLQKNSTKKEISIHELNPNSPLLFLSEEYPLGKLIEKELLEKIEAEIACLPPETRRVFFMSRYDELTHQEIATQLNISVNTVKYHMKQALHRLRSRLKHYLLLIISFFNFFY